MSQTNIAFKTLKLVVSDRNQSIEKSQQAFNFQSHAQDNIISLVPFLRRCAGGAA